MSKKECLLCGGILLETENGYKCHNCLSVFSTETIQENPLKANNNVSALAQNALEKQGNNYLCVCCGGLLERKDGNKYVCKCCNSVFEI